MSEPKPTLALSPWVGRSVLTLLVLQMGLLWLQGSMLQRQHEDILGLREDVQALADSLEQGEDGWNSGGEEGGLSPARHRLQRPVRPRLAKAGLRRRVPALGLLQGQPEEDAAAKKDLEDTRKSGEAAVAQAREVRQKLSIEENIRKAEAKRKLESEGQTVRPWLWAGAGLALLAMIARSWLKRRG